MSEKVVFESPGAWVQVIETPRKFYYLRRKNKDSVAVFLLRQTASKEWEVLVRYQPLPIHNADLDGDQVLFPCPITGGLDLGEAPIDCAIRETLEEAGYRLPKVNPLGRYIVGTQTDETVHMFWADVTNMQSENAIQDGSYFESISRNEWRSLDFLREDNSYAANQIAYLRLSQLEILK